MPSGNVGVGSPLKANPGRDVISQVATKADTLLKVKYASKSAIDTGMSIKPYFFHADLFAVVSGINSEFISISNIKESQSHECEHTDIMHLIIAAAGLYHARD
jgi:hypothetical protein